MERSLRQTMPTVHWTEEVRLDVLSQVISQSVIQAVLSRLGVSEIRVRKLTMELIVLLCIAMNLFTEEAIDGVMRKLVAGQRFLAMAQDERMLSGASAIYQRRQQLGVAPMVALYREVCQPLATPATRDACCAGGLQNVEIQSRVRPHERERISKAVRRTAGQDMKKKAAKLGYQLVPAA